MVLYEVREFAELARAGSYIAGDRRVSPKARTRWRVTFRRLATDAQAALRVEDAAPAEEALALIIDLACEMRDGGYFRSEDPVEAARFVVSDAAALLWESVRVRCGFQALAECAPGQLIRWESPYGWTRGYGQVHDRETSLAEVIARMLPAPDLWAVFADGYLDALDRVARAEGANPRPRHPWVFPDAGYQGFADLAAQIGADLPSRSRELAEQRSQWEAAIAAGRDAALRTLVKRRTDTRK